MGESYSEFQKITDVVYCGDFSRSRTLDDKSRYYEFVNY